MLASLNGRRLVSARTSSCTRDIFPAAADHAGINIAPCRMGPDQRGFKEDPPGPGEGIEQLFPRTNKGDIDECPRQTGHHHPGVEECPGAGSPLVIGRPVDLQQHLPEIAAVPGKDRPVLAGRIRKTDRSPDTRSNPPFEVGDGGIHGRSCNLPDPHRKRPFCRDTKVADHGSTRFAYRQQIRRDMQEPHGPGRAAGSSGEIAHSTTATWGLLSMTVPTTSSSAKGRSGCSPESSTISLTSQYSGEP